MRDAVRVTWSPLGSYEPFRSWNGRARSWGPDDRSRVWFGGDVVDGLVTVLDEHLQRRPPGRRFDTLPAAIGCVPWFTHRGVAERLAQLSSCCIVIDKGHRILPPSCLTAADNGFPNVLPGLRERMPGGEVVVLGPSSPMPGYVVGPVRTVGMSGADSRKPLLHAKLLVLGYEMWGEDDFGHEHHWFKPTSVWWGSANWTGTSRSHLEMGVWSEDVALAREATAFLDDLIGFSEPLTSAAPNPEADLVAVDYDSEAMWEALRDEWDGEEEP
jgi:hypothetical protein